MFKTTGAADLVVGLLAGLVSCLTPEAWLLLPLAIAAAAAYRPGALFSIAIGLGVSLVVTGALVLGFEAVWLRRAVCVLMLMYGLILVSESGVARYPALTGGHGGFFESAGARTSRGVFRMLLLTLLVGANWVPVPGPALVRASMLAADARDVWRSFGTLLVFGIGAALPWIVLGRLLRLLSLPFAPGLFSGMVGKRVLGLTLILVAILGGTGLDFHAAHLLDPLMPAWARRLSVTF